MAIKGKKLTEEEKQKMILSKQKTLLEGYNWSIIDDYLDKDLTSGSRNRSSKYLTLREFKEGIISGKSLKDFLDLGISKHIIAFYSLFSQGRMTITKAEFESEYNSGKSLDEIASKHGISRGHITYLRELYEIKAKGAKFINRKKTEELLTDRQKEILYGSMLGDAKRVSDSAAGFGHGEKQKDYLLWKFNEFKNVSNESSLVGVPYKDKRSGHEGIGWRFSTKANTDIEECIKEFYYNNNHKAKDINAKVLEKLTELSVAVWFMDDGKTDWHYRGIKALNDKNTTPVCTFCTESFSKEGCELAKEWFFSKFGIKVRLKEKKLMNSIGYRIIVENESVFKFLDMIKPYVLPLFQYKVDRLSYMNSVGALESEIKFVDTLELPVGERFKVLDNEEKDIVIDIYLSYFKKRGLYRLMPKSKYLKNSMKKVIDYDTSKLRHEDCIGFNTVGNDFLISHFDNFLTARAKNKKSIKEIFEDKSAMTEIMREILESEDRPNGKILLRKMARYRGNKAVSGFMPCVAKAIFDKYCKDGSSVLDFCAGYGGRLFGAWSSNKVKSYTGIEVNFNTYNNILNLHNNLRLWTDVSKDVTIYNQNSIDGMMIFADKCFDVCFTSPPYFNAEEYDDNINQSCRKYDMYGGWFKEWLIPSINSAIRVSKKTIINIANTGAYKIADDLEKYFKNNGINFVKDFIRLPKMGGGFKYEPMFVI